MAKTPTFKEAFATARGKGVKTFSWNGNKYTTELAAASKSAPKTSPKPSANPRANPTKTGSSSDASVKRSMIPTTNSSTAPTKGRLEKAGGYWSLGRAKEALKSDKRVASDFKAKQGK